MTNFPNDHLFPKQEELDELSVNVDKLEELRKTAQAADAIIRNKTNQTTAINNSTEQGFLISRLLLVADFNQDGLPNIFTSVPSDVQITAESDPSNYSLHFLKIHNFELRISLTTEVIHNLLVIHQKAENNEPIHMIVLYDKIILLDSASEVGDYIVRLQNDRFSKI